MSRPALVLAILAAALAASCSKSSSGVVYVSGTIDPAAPTKIVIDRLVLDFPAGAVALPTAIQLQGVQPFPATGQRVGVGYSALPSLLAFPPGSQPTATYGYGGLTIPAPGPESALALALLGPTGVPVPLPGNAVDTVAKKVTATLPTLGTIVLLAPSAAAPVNGAGTIAFVLDDANGDADLWKSNADGTAPALVTAHTPNELLTGPRAAPGGARFAFSETVGGFPNFRAWVVDASGANRTLVTPDAAQETAGDLDATGTLLYVTRTAPGSATSDLAVYDVSGAPPFTPVLLTATSNDSEHEPRLSPSGLRLLYRDGENLLFSRSATTPGGAGALVMNVQVASYAWNPLMNGSGQSLAVIERPLVSGGGLAEINPVVTYFSLPPPLNGTVGARRPSYSPNGLQYVFELFDTDPTLGVPTLRQIPRQGASGTIFLGGAPTVFHGAAPSCVP